MTSAQTRAAVASSTPLTARSFFARWRAPKSRGHTEFYIQPDDPHRQYNPGDIISGTVVVKVLKPLRITHLVISLHGYAQVFKNPNAPGDAYKDYCASLGSAKGKRLASYHGNGFISLFEDEVVLCGEGMLNEGVYHFHFELQFPARDLPSSIDFERGTIAYMLTATLTRPTTISPTTSHNINVSLANLIDVASVPEPKPRVITLEPVSRRARIKAPKSRPAISNIDGGHMMASVSDGLRIVRMAEAPSSHSEPEGPRSPSPSDVSFESQISSGSASLNAEAISSKSGHRSSAKGKTITALIAVLKGGFLRGDQIPIRITVNHTKHVRSLKGIIVTLYRQARVDMHPVPPEATNSKVDKRMSDESGPKSKTGLGGLSLSLAGSSHVFRKDLCQSFAPLFVDPRTLTAEVKCAVRVPDEAFPTISNVPGAMISFKYYVEVIVDIQGKMNGLDRMVENVSLLDVPSAGIGNARIRPEDGTSNMFTTWGTHIIDTDQIRREKAIISALFEVVIGTKDSDRSGKHKQKQQPLATHDWSYHRTVVDGSTGADSTNGYDLDQREPNVNRWNHSSAYQDAPEYDQQSAVPSAPYNLPSTSMEGDHTLSEKDRLRRAEARLLPSEPPPVNGSSTSDIVQYSLPASAPYLPNDEDDKQTDTVSFPPNPSSLPSHQSLPLHNVTSSPRRDPTGAPGNSTGIATGVPPLTKKDDNRGFCASTTREAASFRIRPSFPPSSNTQASNAVPEYRPSGLNGLPTNDKQELERQRSEMESSKSLKDGDAEEKEEEEEAESSQQASARGTDIMKNSRIAPSAPVLDDDDEDLISAVRPARDIQGNMDDNRRASDALPEYQR